MFIYKKIGVLASIISVSRALLIALLAPGVEEYSIAILVELFSNSAYFLYYQNYDHT